MTRKALILVTFTVLLVGESVYFARLGGAAIMDMKGGRAFFRNDLRGALRAYDAAESMGAAPEDLARARAEVLLFGLDQIEAGVKPNLPLPPRQALAMSRDLVSELIRGFPYRAYHWSLAADVHSLEARRQRRERPIDIAALSEDPLQNLLPEEWLEIEALQVAARVEPNNAVYTDLLAEIFLDTGSPEQAAAFVRRAVAALPDFDEHPYLARPDLPGVVVDAALRGFEDARQTPSVALPVSIDTDAARLLTEHGRDREALPWLEAATRVEPRYYLPRLLLGLTRSRLGEDAAAVQDLQRAAELRPQDAWVHYFHGLALRRQGKREEAIAALRRARVAAPGEIRFFHALGEALEEAERPAEAERQYAAAANSHPNDPSAWSALLAFYARRGDGAGKQRVCDRLRSQKPDDPALANACVAGEGALR